MKKNQHHSFATNNSDHDSDSTAKIPGSSMGAIVYGGCNTSSESTALLCFSTHHKSPFTDSSSKSVPSNRQNVSISKQFLFHGGSTNNLVEDSDSSRSQEEDIAESARKHLKLKLEYCFAVMFGYVLFGAVSYSCMVESWTIVDSVYFSVVTFTTVGYGDLVPTGRTGRLFTVFYSLVGISVLGIILGVIGEHVIDSHVASIEQAKKDGRDWVMMMFERERDGKKTADRGLQAGKRVVSGATDTGVSPFRKYVPILFILTAASFSLAWFEGWDLTNGLYFCVMTLTTVGYGDFSPSTNAMRIFAALYIPVAVGVMGVVLGDVAVHVMERKHMKFLEKVREREFKLADLKAMDTAGDGKVSMLEYVEFMLISMKKVDRQLLEKLHEQFHRIDVTGSGHVEKEDLRLMAMHRLQRVDETQLHSA